ncbi:ISAs1 family transposase [Actinomyces viscosus]|uniref:Transposase n=1 Tax=Actinomyces viscosus TaxID=1656 RepID=A0A3S4VCR9_ACTVI|nr:ISAs1 family transposase [Actinomyces viscosus]VEI14717.1 Transposase [Actinomyces viscosus]VEI16687.1 Transposase [Actinomyces viscosus]VEI18676.1 Transposase [Actinomyces viscosus]
MLAGCRSLTAIWEHTTDLTGADLRSLGLEEGQALPSESTIRRVLQDLDPADLDAHLMTWFYTRTGTINGRTVIAVDGKTMRAARRGEDPAPHLLAALDHATGAVLTQERVAGKSNEIPALRVLLEPLDLDGVVVTADAMHTQVDTARWITRRGGHYVFTVKGNQKTLRRTLKALPWKDVPSISSVERCHGRWVRRTVKALEAPQRVDFPAAAQVIQIRRTRTVKGRKRVEVVYLICSLPMTDAQPEAVAAWVRGHWGIENRLHWIRDVVFDEDRHQLSTRNGPEIMAALRNLAISLIRLFLGPGVSIASTTRSLSRRPKRAISLQTQPTP